LNRTSRDHAISAVNQKFHGSAHVHRKVSNTLAKNSVNHGKQWCLVVSAKNLPTHWGCANKP